MKSSMKALVLAVAAGAVLLAGFKATRNADVGTDAGFFRKVIPIVRDRERPVPRPSTTPIPSSVNPFGVMIPAARLSTTQKLEMAQQLNVDYYRTVDVKVHTSSVTCAECTTFSNAGIKLVLTVRNGGGGGTPSTPPSDYNLYRTNITKVLDTYRPALLVVENEENSQALFYSGTPAQYHTELSNACAVAHSKGYKCTNGGLVSNLVAHLVAEEYYVSGETDLAEDFYRRAIAGRDGADATYARQRQNPQLAPQLQRGQQLLAGYKDAGADYVNFHWYVADTKALEEAVKYLEQITGLPAMTNELGQQNNEDPAQVTAVMQKVQSLRLPYAIWFSQDTQGFAGARSLFNEDGTIRPNGQAFADFIAANY